VRFLGCPVRGQEHSSGAVEGNVTRIKRIKRDGYGRAKFDLLRAQILIAA
jgi:transposase